MIVRKVLALRGPNIWARVPVLEAWVDLEGLKDRLPRELPGFLERLAALLIPLDTAVNGARSPVGDRLRQEPGFEDLLTLLVADFQERAGSEVGFRAARRSPEGSTVRLGVQFQEEEVARGALDLAIGAALAAIDGRPCDVAGEVDRLRQVAREVG